MMLTSEAIFATLGIFSILSTSFGTSGGLIGLFGFSGASILGKSFLSLLFFFSSS